MQVQFWALAVTLGMPSGSDGSWSTSLHSSSHQQRNPHSYLTQGHQIPPELSERAYVAYIRGSTARWFWVRARRFRCHSLWNFVLYAFVHFVILVVLCPHISRHFKKIGKFSNFFKFTASYLFEFLRSRLGAQDELLYIHSSSTLGSLGSDN